MSPSYLPSTVDGSVIPAEAPRSQGMSDEHAEWLVERAESYRETLFHFDYTTTGRDISVTAANAEGAVFFDFGDGSAEVEGETASHSYSRDGVYLVGARDDNDRFFEEIPIKQGQGPSQELPA